MKIAFYGDSLTEGIPGAAYTRILAGKLTDRVRLNRAGARIVAEAFLERIHTSSHRT